MATALEVPETEIKEKIKLEKDIAKKSLVKAGREFKLAEIEHTKKLEAVRRIKQELQAHKSKEEATALDEQLKLAQREETEGNKKKLSAKQNLYKADIKYRSYSNNPFNMIYLYRNSILVVLAGVFIFSALATLAIFVPPIAAYLAIAVSQLVAGVIVAGSALVGGLLGLLFGMQVSNPIDVSKQIEINKNLVIPPIDKNKTEPPLPPTAPTSTTKPNVDPTSQVSSVPAQQSQPTKSAAVTVETEASSTTPSISTQQAQPPLKPSMKLIVKQTDAEEKTISTPLVTQQASSDVNPNSEEVTGSTLPKSPKNKNLDATLSTTPSTQQVSPLSKPAIKLTEEKAISPPIVTQKGSADVNHKPEGVTGSTLPQSPKTINADATIIPSSASLTVTEKAGTFSDSMNAANEEESKRQASQAAILFTPVAVNEANSNATNAQGKEDAPVEEHSTDDDQVDVVPLDINMVNAVQAKREAEAAQKKLEDNLRPLPPEEDKTDQATNVNKLAVSL